MVASEAVEDELFVGETLGGEVRVTVDRSLVVQGVFGRWHLPPPLEGWSEAIRVAMNDALQQAREAGVVKLS